MKSPMVYKNTEMKIGFFIGILASTIISVTTYDVLKIWQIVGYFLVITGGLTLWGWAWRLGTIYNRKVDHPVELDELVEGQTYYLNGEFQAKFLHRNGDTGEFVFKIEGLEDEVDVPLNRVDMYFSSEKEV